MSDVTPELLLLQQHIRSRVITNNMYIFFDELLLEGIQVNKYFTNNYTNNVNKISYDHETTRE
jgi:hypothetical protein